MLKDFAVIIVGAILTGVCSSVIGHQIGFESGGMPIMGLAFGILYMSQLPLIALRKKITELETKLTQLESQVQSSSNVATNVIID